MAEKNDIANTPEAWESREIGSEEEFVKIAEEINEMAIDDSLGLQMISIRMQKSLIEDFKLIAKMNGMGYQPLMKQVLKRFADCEKKRILREHAAHIKDDDSQLEEDDHLQCATG